MSTPPTPLVTEIRRLLSLENAAQVADLFLSPHIDPQLLVAALSEEGPGAAMWVVNRSDVYDETLEALRSHPVIDISRRAEEKTAQRRSKLWTLDPPLLPPNLVEIPDSSVEDVLGHPLVPFAAVLHFAKSPNPDHRGSAALGLTRRLLEYPPDWAQESVSSSKLVDAFAKMLLSDPSAYARSYAARIPILPPSIIDEASRQEPQFLVAARLLQNPKVSLHTLLSALERRRGAHATSLVEIVAALDRRVPKTARKGAFNSSELTPLARRIHQWYLEN